jgi:hypothetical protein
VRIQRRCLAQFRDSTFVARDLVGDIKPEVLVQPRELVAQMGDEFVRVPDVLSGGHICGLDTLKQIAKSSAYLGTIDGLQTYVDGILAINILPLGIVFFKRRAGKQSLKSSIDPTASAMIRKSKHDSLIY